MEATAIVRIAQGALRGLKTRTHLGVPFYSFRGIPYAKAPVGDLRFKAPEKAEPWKGIRNAIDMPPTAPQMAFLTDNLFTGEEDCLFINVFTPQLPSSKGAKPVLVYIHGGGFFMGSGNNQMHGPGRIMNTGKVVLVTMNYRLGVLGFLSTGDSVMPGNNGLKDQTMALRWVQDNIAEFGGDPDNVTIAGVSAGALCTHLHVFSPMSKGLFHKAIVQSGSALSPWAARHPDNARRRAFRFGRTLGLDTDNSEQLLKFLKKAPARKLVEDSEAAHLIEEKHPFPMLFQPVLEPPHDMEAFLPEWPLNVIRSSAYNAVPMITGVTSREGLFFIKDVSGSSSWYESMNEDNYDNLLYVHLNLPKGVPETHQLTKRVVRFYFGDKRICKETWANLVDLYGDVLFSVWVDKTAKEHTRASADVPLYFYQFAFDGRFSLNRGHGQDAIPGVAHAADLGYLFETSFNPVHYFDKDDDSMKTCRRMANMWLNFAQTGNPTPPNRDENEELGGVTWRQYTREEANYLNIGRDLSMRKDLSKDTLDFWYSLPIPDVPQM